MRQIPSGHFLRVYEDVIKPSIEESGFVPVELMKCQRLI
jgi:hypothetical protein